MRFGGSDTIDTGGWDRNPKVRDRILFLMVIQPSLLLNPSFAELYQNAAALCHIFRSAKYIDFEH